VRPVACRALAAIAALLVPGSGAFGLTIAAMPLEELTGHATLVVRARCVDRQVTRTADGNVESLARFAVVEEAKGSASGLVTVRQLGGRIDDTEVLVPGAPLAEAGDDVVLFLEPHDGEVLGVVGVALGYMPVATLPGSGAVVRTSRVLGADFASGSSRPVSELLERVRAIVRRSSGR
jgi:hypothetical protein